MYRKSIFIFNINITTKSKTVSIFDNLRNLCIITFINFPIQYQRERFVFYIIIQPRFLKMVIFVIVLDANENVVWLHMTFRFRTLEKFKLNCKRWM